MLLICVGCDLRMMDPRWNSLTKKGVMLVPGEYDSANFVHGDVTDEKFAAAVKDLKKVGVKEINFQYTQLTDRSIDGVLQLRRLEKLYVNGTNFTADGLVRLSALPRLKRLYFAAGKFAEDEDFTRQFTEEELSRIRAALPTVEVRSTPGGAYRFRKPSTRTATTRPHY